MWHPQLFCLQVLTKSGSYAIITYVAFKPAVSYAVYAAGKWGISSAGRAPGSQSGGQGFDPPMLHHRIFRTIRETFGFRGFFIYFGGDQKYEKNFLRMQYTTQAPIYSQNFAVRLWNGWCNSMTKN